MLINNGQLRIEDTKLAQVQEQNNNDLSSAAMTENGKKYWMLALEAFENKDFHSALLQVGFALQYESSNETFKEFKAKGRSGSQKGSKSQQQPIQDSFVEQGRPPIQVSPFTIVQKNTNGYINQPANNRRNIQHSTKSSQKNKLQSSTTSPFQSGEWMMDSQGDTGAESEVYFCIRASSTKVNRRRQHRTSTFRTSSTACRATPIVQLDTLIYALPTRISMSKFEPFERAKIHPHQRATGRLSQSPTHHKRMSVPNDHHAPDLQSVEPDS